MTDENGISLLLFLRRCGRRVTDVDGLTQGLSSGEAPSFSGLTHKAAALADGLSRPPSP